MWVYGQTEITKDLIDTRLADGQQILWEVAETSIVDADTDHPSVGFVDRGRQPAERSRPTTWPGATASTA